jgi:hypothetical protein
VSLLKRALAPTDEDVVTAISDAREAEFASATWLRRHGWPDAHVTGSRADSGVDLEGLGIVAVVEHRPRSLGRKDLRTLASIAVERAVVGCCFTSTGFNRQAVDFAKATGLGLYRYDHHGHFFATVPIEASGSTRAAAGPTTAAAPATDLEARMSELSDTSSRIIAAIQHRESALLTGRQRRRLNRARQVVLTTSSLLERLDAAYTEGRWRKADRLAREVRSTFDRAERLLS